MANVLIVDDDADIRPMLRATLTKLGHTPTLASNGEEGLAAALIGQFDAIVLDLMMPDLDGYEVTRRLRTNPRTKDVPILVLTARTQPADHQSALSAGADDYLAKPFDSEVLGSRIVEVIKKGRERQTTPLGRVLPVLGLRGGVGVTTLAVNLAGALLRAGRRVCLVDLSPSGGHAALQLRLRPQPTWAELPTNLNQGNLSSALLHHESGLALLAAPPQPVRKGMSAEAFQAVLGLLRMAYAEVVVDAAPWLDDPTYAALMAARQVVLMLTPEVGAVQTTLNTLKALAGLGLTDQQTSLVLNYISPEPGLTQAAIEKAIGRAPDLSVPFDRAQAAALTQGAPLVFGQAASPLVAALGPFALKL